MNQLVTMAAVLPSTGVTPPLYRSTPFEYVQTSQAGQAIVLIGGAVSVTGWVALTPTISAPESEPIET
jgi:hypothetical protein